MAHRASGRRRVRDPRAPASCEGRKSHSDRAITRFRRLQGPHDSHGSNKSHGPYRRQGLRESRGSRAPRELRNRTIRAGRAIAHVARSALAHRSQEPLRHAILSPRRRMRPNQSIRLRLNGRLASSHLWETNISPGQDPIAKSATWGTPIQTQTYRLHTRIRPAKPRQPHPSIRPRPLRIRGWRCGEPMVAARFDWFARFARAVGRGRHLARPQAGPAFPRAACARGRRSTARLRTRVRRSPAATGQSG